METAAAAPGLTWSNLAATEGARTRIGYPNRRSSGLHAVPGRAHVTGHEAADIIFRLAGAAQQLFSAAHPSGHPSLNTERGLKAPQALFAFLTGATRTAGGRYRYRYIFYETTDKPYQGDLNTESGKDTSQWSTMHIYFSDPQEVTCRGKPRL
eukprot:scaffold137576_cov72-Phaeocystis_antarctica.AAC.1